MFKEDLVKEQDRLLPAANVGRMMKKMVPNDVKIEKNTKDFVAVCVSEFISFITSEASDKCMQEKRKTLNGEDIVWALHNMGMENYVEPLRVYLTKYRESRNDKFERPDKRPKLTIEELTASGQFEDSSSILRSVWNPNAHPVRKDKNNSRSHASMMSGASGNGGMMASSSSSSSSLYPGSSLGMKREDIKEEEDDEEEEDEEEDEG